jgi:hypothetical protein
MRPRTVLLLLVAVAAGDFRSMGRATPGTKKTNLVRPARVVFGTYRSTFERQAT